MENEHMFTTDEQQWVKKVAESSGAKIQKSSIFLSLFTENYKSDPVAALQFGIAILLNKPLFFAVERGTVINDNIKGVAHGIEYYDASDPISLERAVKKLTDKAEKLGFM